MEGTGPQVSVTLNTSSVLTLSMVKLSWVNCWSDTVACGFCGFGFSGAPDG